MIDYRKDNYRITNIYNIITGVCPDSEGLAIEKQCENSDSYYVVMFIKPDKHGDAEVEDIGLRVLNIEDEEWSLVKRLIRIAKDIVEIANEEP